MGKQLLGLRLGTREQIGGETRTEFTDVLTAWDQRYCRYRHCTNHLKWPSDPKIQPNLPNSTWNIVKIEDYIRFHSTTPVPVLWTSWFPISKTRTVSLNMSSQGSGQQPIWNSLIAYFWLPQLHVRQGARQSSEKMQGRTWKFDIKPRTPQDKENLT
jgi:hypothetical protein